MSETALIIKMQQSGKEHQQFGVRDKAGHTLASPVFAQDGDGDRDGATGTRL